MEGESPLSGYAIISVTHHALRRERNEALRHATAVACDQPECVSIGHAWTEDSGREGGLICVVCQVVRPP